MSCVLDYDIFLSFITHLQGKYRNLKCMKSTRVGTRYLKPWISISNLISIQKPSCCQVSKLQMITFTETALTIWKAKLVNSNRLQQSSDTKLSWIVFVSFGYLEFSHSRLGLLPERKQISAPLAGKLNNL